MTTPTSAAQPDPAPPSDAEIDAMMLAGGWRKSADGKHYECDAVAPPNPALLVSRRMQGCCMDCGRKYGDEFGFPDLVVSPEAWRALSPTKDDGGLLCPSCMCRRAHDAGLETRAKFRSGPFTDEGCPSCEMWAEKCAALAAERDEAKKQAEIAVNSQRTICRAAERLTAERDALRLEVEEDAGVRRVWQRRVQEAEAERDALRLDRKELLDLANDWRGCLCSGDAKHDPSCLTCREVAVRHRCAADLESALGGEGAE